MKIGRNDPCPCNSGMKYKKCHYGKVFSFRAERFVISAQRNGIFYKIFQLVFHHKKGTDKAAIFISFPYHKNSKGLLSMVTFPHHNLKVDKLSLVPGGRVTSNKIKYTHWKDGNVHFSQDGKIYTFKKEIPSDCLDKDIGHIFTIHLKGLNGFEKKIDPKKNSSRVVDLDVNLGEDGDDSIKFTGWWHDDSTVHPSRAEFKTSYLYKQDDGPINSCFALQPPMNTPLSNKVLFLCVRKEFMTKEQGTHLLLTGGYDKKEQSKDIKNDLHFLSMLYPARNYAKLKEKIGSVDLPANRIIKTVD